MSSLATRPTTATARGPISADQIFFPSRDEAAVWCLTGSLLLSKFAAISSALLLVGFAICAVRRPRSFIGPWDRRDVAPVALALLVATIASAFLVGTLSTSPEFLTQEGRVMIGLLVWVNFAQSSTVKLSFGRRWIRACALLAAGMILLSFVPGIRSLVMSTRGNVFWGLGSSHHVTGYTFGILGAVAVALRRRGARIRLPEIAVLFLASGLTTSRTTLLGLLAIPVVALITLPRSRSMSRQNANTIFAAIFLGAAVVLTAAFTFSTSVGEALSLPRLEEVSAHLGDIEESRDGEAGAIVGGGDSVRETNVLKRVSAWRRAWLDGQASPLVGVGAFRYNDIDRNFVNPAPFVEIATSAGEEDIGDFGAHNVYLQVFGELGLVGLLLMLSIQVRASGVILRRTAGRAEGMLLVGLVWATGFVSNGTLSPSLVVGLVVASLVLPNSEAEIDLTTPVPAQ